MISLLALGMAEAPWLAGARAKYASLQGTTSNPSAAFLAAVAKSTSLDAAQKSYQALTLEGAASVWSALDYHYDSSFVEGFSDEAYAEMLHDESRTPFFERAIRERLAESPPKTLAVLDIGTGPFAILSILAAEAGARKVYALEVNPEAAKRARKAIAAAGWRDVIEVLDGFSTTLPALPERVDVVVSEVVGSIASEEGLYATIQDAHARFVKAPHRRDSWIPHRVETWAAPASYALHAALGPPRYDWGAIEEPLRLGCHDETLLALAAPQRVEAISFAEGAPTPGPVDATFEITDERLAVNEAAYFASLISGGIAEPTARRHAQLAARGLSGLAMWPRLVLRGEGSGEDDIVVDSRGPGSRGASAGPGSSGWQTVLPLLDARPVVLKAGDLVRTTLCVELPERLEDPVWYAIEFS